MLLLMDLRLRITLGVLWVVEMLLKPLFWLRDQKPLKRVPAIKNRLLLQSATKIAAEIRSGKLKSEEVVKVYIDRIKAVEPIINAVVQDRFDEALKEAKQVDELIAKKEKSEIELETQTPLLGVPQTIKECIAVKGMSNSGMSLHPMGKGRKADKDAEVVSRLRKAGAIILLVSNTPEFCLSWETYNKIKGQTNNPYNTNRTSSGSSGGEGALLGSGAAILGVGSDLGGSIRLPGAFNGIFGHKPTSQIVPLEGHFPMIEDENFKKYLVIGPMTRYAEDLKLMMKVLASDKIDLLKLNEKVDLTKINVFIKESVEPTFICKSTNENIRKRIQDAAGYLKHKVANISYGNGIRFDSILEISCSQFGQVTNMPDFMEDPSNSKKKKSLIVEFLKILFGMSELTLNLVYFGVVIREHFFVKYPKRYDICKKELLECLTNTLGSNGVLLFPTFPIPAFQHHEAIFKNNCLIYTMIFNVLGFPSTNVPLGLDENGIPIGVQVISLPNQDRLCLAVAEELEKGFGGWVPPTTIEL